MICALIEEASLAVRGAHQRAPSWDSVCARWNDGVAPILKTREGPRRAPTNKLTAEERATLLDTVNSAAYRDQSPLSSVYARRIE
jgi:hypothetical protein